MTPCMDFVATLSPAVILALNSLEVAFTAYRLDSCAGFSTLQTLAVPLFACHFAGPMIANSFLAFFKPKKESLSAFFIGCGLFLILRRAARFFEFAGLVLKCNMLIFMLNSEICVSKCMFWIMTASITGSVIFKVITKNKHFLCLTINEMCNVLGTLFILAFCKILNLHEVCVPAMVALLYFLKFQNGDSCCVRIHAKKNDPKKSDANNHLFESQNLSDKIYNDSEIDHQRKIIQKKSSRKKLNVMRLKSGERNTTDDDYSDNNGISQSESHLLNQGNSGSEEHTENDNTGNTEDTIEKDQAAPKRKRGRPRKTPIVVEDVLEEKKTTTKRSSKK